MTEKCTGKDCNIKEGCIKYVPFLLLRLTEKQNENVTWLFSEYKNGSCRNFEKREE